MPEVRNYGSDKPPAMDDGWWRAVLGQEENPRATERESLSNGGEHGRGYSASATGNGHAGNAWDEALRVYNEDETVELLVIGHNRGGLIVSWGSLRGFVPASHLEDFPVDISEQDRRRFLAERVGRTLDLKVIEYDADRGRVVLSERAARSGPGSRQALLTRLKSNDIVEGAVTNVTDFGAFVDLGGVEGLLHVSELSWGRVDHPRQVLSPGQRVRVFVISVEPDKGRIALSLKRLQPDPWATVEERYEVGQIVEGTITDVVPFGAFTCVEDGLEGLIHVSELAEGNFMHPANVVKQGQTVRARIVSIDGPGRRLGLSLRKAESDDWQSGEQTL
ncbi:MAG: 30S ribosomal protein S1 [Anaerolineales bacterium]